MTIIDRARDALKRYEVADPWDSFEPHKALEALEEIAPELAAAVDRAAYLADDLDREASDLRRNAPVVADGIADIKSRAAARIRQALEGAEE